ncbi:hypothetical protein [Bradyrhizobium sp. 191]|uniref:hypothetical protein n=1 Tax=Bradyrhizobium sp. 191 TaxID=2782659 RepID=UPI001FFE814B|nr:hypothetical protein [Bradyrhizobium sp. 191]UPJ68249.1 hypothetical protein IVB23_13300 [Bradyrhizobium sp. 191]
MILIEFRGARSHRASRWRNQLTVPAPAERVFSNSEDMLMLPVMRFSLISRCTRRAHSASNYLKNLISRSNPSPDKPQRYSCSQSAEADLHVVRPAPSIEKLALMVERFHPLGSSPITISQPREDE